MRKKHKIGSSKKKHLFEKVKDASFTTGSDEGYLGAVDDHFGKRLRVLRHLLDIRTPELDTEPDIIILSCCFLDALSSIFYGAEIESGVRFRKILYDFGDLGRMFKKISLIEFEKLLKTEEFKSIADAYAHNIGKRIEAIDYANISESIKHDPLFEDLCRDLLVISDANPDLLNELLEKSTYASILYSRYRCPSVHEGVAREHLTLFEEKSVHYVGFIGERAVLVFPVSFLCDLVENIFIQIQEKMLEKMEGER